MRFNYLTSRNGISIILFITAVFLKNYGSCFQMIIQEDLDESLGIFPSILKSWLSGKISMEKHQVFPPFGIKDSQSIYVTDPIFPFRLICYLLLFSILYMLHVKFICYLDGSSVKARFREWAPTYCSSEELNFGRAGYNTNLSFQLIYRCSFCDYFHGREIILLHF